MVGDFQVLLKPGGVVSPEIGKRYFYEVVELVFVAQTDATRDGLVRGVRA